MGAASTKACVQNPIDSSDVNTNIFFVNFKFLQYKLYTPCSTAPTKCQNCSAYLSQISSRSIYSAKNTQTLTKTIAPEITNRLNSLSESQSLWKCEYCSTINIIEQSPSLPNTEYIQYTDFFNDNDLATDSATHSSVENPSGSFFETNQSNQSENSQVMPISIEKQRKEQIMYVLDNSASMNGIEFSKKEGESIQITRKQGMIESIRSQATSLKSLETGEDDPSKEIQLVIFSTDVQIYPVIQQEPVILTKEALESWDEIVAQTNPLQSLMTGCSYDEMDSILQVYQNSTNMGCTALGPAILASVEVSKPNSGSQIIVCTDGSANQGLGSMQNPGKKDEYLSFYNKVADHAKAKGIQISILAIGNDAVGLDTVGRLAERTNGSVFKIDLENMNSKLDNILSDKILGSDTNVKLFLHNSVYLDSDSNTDLEIDVGNATSETCLTFEYLFRDELLADLISIPFQAQIEYTDLNNKRQLVVISKSIEITNNRKAVENDLKMEFVEKRMAQKSADLVEKGEFENASAFQMQWQNVIQNNSNYAGYQEKIENQQKIISEFINTKEATNNQKEETAAKLQQMKKGKFY